MKIKNLLVTALCLVSLVAANAQTPSFNKGSGVLNLTIGFGNGLYSGTTSSVPPIAASYEVGIVDNIAEKGSIGIGGYLGYTSAKWDFGYGYSVKSSDIVIGVRGLFHYPFVDKLDTYAGLLLGYDINSWSTTGTAFEGISASNSYGGLKIGIFAGARYYFSDMFAGVVEVGTGLAYFNIGVALKLSK